MQKKNIGLIGCGEWGKNILRDLKSLHCEVTVISNNKKSYDYATQGGADYIYDSVQKIKHIDGFIIATPATTHAAVIDLVAHFNVPIFCEKVFTTRLSDAKRLAESLSDRLFVMHKWRYHPGIQILGHMVRRQELGAVMGLHTKRYNWGNHHHDVDMLWTCLPHDLSISIEILGSIPQPNTAQGIEWGHEAVELNCFLGEKTWNLIEISSIRPTIQREIRVICENGFMILPDGLVNHIEIHHQKNWGLTPTDYIEYRHFDFEMPLKKELEVFLHYLCGGPKPPTNAQEGLAVVETIIQLREMAGFRYSGMLQEATYV